jgi:carbonic anhydrase
MSEPYNYYNEQVKYLLPIDEYGVQIKMTSTKGGTKWMPLNDESFKAVTDVLIILRGASIKSEEIKDPDMTEFERGRESVYKEMRETINKLKDQPSHAERVEADISKMRQLIYDLDMEKAKNVKLTRKLRRLAP